jgi:hypothetical protein
MSEPITSASGTPAWSRSAARRPRVSWLQRLLGVATAATLAVDAYVHLHDAGSYDSVTSSVLSEATLFRAQAILAALVAVALVLRPRPVAWAVAVLVAAAAIGAVLLYTYVDVGALGPLPDMYEPTWNLPGKAASAYAEAAAVLLALSGFVVALRDDRRAARTGPVRDHVEH